VRLRDLGILLLLAPALPLGISCTEGSPQRPPRAVRKATTPRDPPPPGDLLPDERATMAVFETVSPSVVFITTRTLRRDFWSMNLFEVPQGSGSGFIWDREGHIVTNFHVIAGANAISVVTADRAEYRAKVVGADPDHDLAVLVVPAPPESLTPVVAGDVGRLRVGQKVLAIGNPFGLDHTLTTGIVSALGRSIRSMSDRTIEGVIQTDAAINPGNSGGPLLDSSGRLIGINTQIVSPSGAYAGVGFAVPVDIVQWVVPELIRYGKLIRPGLGVTLLQDGIARRWGIQGVAVVEVDPQGAAGRAGLRGMRQTLDGNYEVGDVITGLDGEAIADLDDLYRILDRHKVGDRVLVEALRDGKKRKVPATLQQVE
jgi:S1-C subfamily serine protease